MEIEGSTARFRCETGKTAYRNFRRLGSASKPFELDFTDALGRVRDFTLLVGPNGCGKTAILDSIAAAIGPTLEMPTLRPGFKRSPRAVVARGALHAKVTCWLRFDRAEIDAARQVFQLAESTDSVPDASEVKLMWTYPNSRGKSDFGFTQCDPSMGWTLLKTRVQIARLLATGRVGWDWFHRAGGVFTFDQERTGLGKTISRQVWKQDDRSSGVGTKSRTTFSIPKWCSRCSMNCAPCTASLGQRDCLQPRRASMFCSNHSPRHSLRIMLAKSYGKRSFGRSTPSEV